VWVAQLRTRARRFPGRTRRRGADGRPGVVAGPADCPGEGLAGAGRGPVGRGYRRRRGPGGGEVSEQGSDAQQGAGNPVDPLTPVLTRNWGDERAWKLSNYERTGGYDGVRTALRMSRDDVTELVKDAGLRGRGGAGFPTAVKWSFVPKDNPNATYLVINADESEPGTCKDIPLMMASPHTLIEGAIISAYAIGAEFAFIYIRGEVLHVARRLQQAAREAYSA